MCWYSFRYCYYGYGLCHIIDEHEDELKQLGFKIEEFIPLVFTFGIYSESQKENKIKLSGEKFMLIIKLSGMILTNVLL